MMSGKLCKHIMSAGRDHQWARVGAMGMGHNGWMQQIIHWSNQPDFCGWLDVGGENEVPCLGSGGAVGAGSWEGQDRRRGRPGWEKSFRSTLWEAPVKIQEAIGLGRRNTVPIHSPWLFLRVCHLHKANGAKRPVVWVGYVKVPCSSVSIICLFFLHLCSLCIKAWKKLLWIQAFPPWWELSVYLRGRLQSGKAHRL